MRITNNLMSSDLLYSLQNQYSKMSELQDWMSSGSRILSASDDPTGAAIALDLVEDYSQYTQHTRNMNEGNLWFNLTSSSLQQVSDVIKTAQEKCVAGADLSKSQADRDTLAMEVESLLNHLVMLGNTTLYGQSIFSGNQTSRTPFVINKTGDYISSVTYQGDAGEREFQTTSTERTVVNTLGSNAGDSTKHGLFVDVNESINMFESLIKLRDDLLEAEIDSGTATGPGVGPGSTTLQDATKSWGQDELVGYRVRITSGTGAGQERIIYSNSSGTLKVDSAWDTAPDATSVYEITGNKNNLSGITKIRDYGTGTAGGATTITDAAQSWPVNRWQGYQVRIVGGTGEGQTRTIFSSTADTLTVTQAWETAPDATSKYEIVALNEHTGNNRLYELDKLDANISKHMALVGTKMKRFEWNGTSTEFKKADTVKQLNAVQGVDIAEAMIQYQSYQLAYQATAQLGGKIMPMSLLNFLG